MNKSKILVSVLLLAVALFFVSSVSAWSDDGTLTQNVDGCGELNTTNATYTLTSNVSSSGTCFTIAAENITLDGAGYSVNYSGSSDVGVYSNQNFTTIKNMDIFTDTNGKSTIDIEDSLNNTIFNNTLTTNGFYDGYGVDFSNTNNSNISHNTIRTYFGFGYGIRFFQSNNNIIEYNSIITTGDTGRGYAQYYSNNNTIQHNFIKTSNTGGNALWIHTGDNNNFTNNTLWTQGDTAKGIMFYLGPTTGNSFSDINITTEYQYGDGIYLRTGEQNFTMKDSTINVQNPSFYDIYMNSVTGGFWNLTNVSREDGEQLEVYYIAGGEGTLNVKYYVDAQTNFTHNGTAVENANVSAYDNTGLLRQSELTNINGQISTWELLAYDYVDSVKTSYTNYTINTTYSGWDVNSQSIALLDNEDLQVNISDETEPSLNILFPETSITYNYHNMSLNFSTSDAGVGLDTCWKRLNDGTNVTIDCSLNSTVNSTDDGTIEGTNTIYIWANDTLGNLASDSITFGVSTAGPATNLNYPTDNLYLDNGTDIDFNFTSSDADGIDTCELWGNWSGSWAKNYTWSSVTSGVEASTSISLLDGNYNWNVWCNDTGGVESWSLNNYTVTVDETNPSVTIDSITTTTGSQSISFNTTISDTNLDYCHYSIYNLAGTIDGSNENVTFDCSSASTSVSSYATYNLYVTAFDLAGNSYTTNQSFTTTSSTPSTGGGGGTTIITPTEGEIGWEMTAGEGGSSFGFSMIAGTERSRDISFQNVGDTSRQIELTCQDVEGSVCQYVSYDKASFSLPLIKDLITRQTMIISLPDGIEEGEYIFNVVATDDSDNVAILTTTVKVKSDLFSSIAIRLLSSAVIFGITVPYLLIILFLTSLIAFVSYWAGLNNLKAGGTTSIFIGFMISLVLINFI